ncbi:hypothetical protein K491DRAFT_226140 [Lophiostoma macrostomum CBS 122681]|uniref:Uncharacterized protein n=1 Tax=Lophiostoma macrostomum CBS 122681 TaxID=1314788 RepID=A0A6A6TH12_9PLEO|nr:hypothetical protein K491DRAFT_226140 [Lophiostoma macrostomum CBS 122681]
MASDVHNGGQDSYGRRSEVTHGHRISSRHNSDSITNFALVNFNRQSSSSDRRQRQRSSNYHRPTESALGIELNYTDRSQSSISNSGPSLIDESAQPAPAPRPGWPVRRRWCAVGSFVLMLVAVPSIILPILLSRHSESSRVDGVPRQSMSDISAASSITSTSRRTSSPTSLSSSLPQSTQFSTPSSTSTEASTSSLPTSMMKGSLITPGASTTVFTYSYTDPITCTQGCPGWPCHSINDCTDCFYCASATGGTSTCAGPTETPIVSCFQPTA